MTELPIKPGLLLLDDHNRTGIVRQLEPRPSAKWLRELVHADEVAALPVDVRWWGVLPLDGGYVLSPEPMLRPIRETSYEDFFAAVEGGNEAARRSLAELFPDYVRRAAARIGLGAAGK